MRIIGVTGPSGAGKGALCELLKKRGIVCIDADAVYHSLLVPPSECLDALKSAFGESVFLSDGSLDRAALGRIVFAESDKLELLNSTVLSYVLAKFRVMIAELKAKGEVAVVIDAPTLIESELFGHEKGAFTGAEKLKIGKFEAASGGTLFLDEITEIDLATQVKLLRVLESRTLQRVGGNDDVKVDFRLVAATNRDLAEYVRAGKFREDLYYRLNVIDIRLPALRDRPGDIALLVSRFIKEFAGKNDIAIKGIDAAAVKILESYSWPGNVRQLRNVIERMVVLSDGTRLTVGDIPEEILAAGVTALAARRGSGRGGAHPRGGAAHVPRRRRENGHFKSARGVRLEQDQGRRKTRNFKTDTSQKTQRMED